VIGGNMKWNPTVTANWIHASRIGSMLYLPMPPPGFRTTGQDR
jgi:hypothetical protein